jgi:hypothetical protein
VVTVVRVGLSLVGQVGVLRGWNRGCARGGKCSQESEFCGISSKKVLAQTQVIAPSGFHMVGFSAV